MREEHAGVTAENVKGPCKHILASLPRTAHTPGTTFQFRMSLAGVKVTGIMDSGATYTHVGKRLATTHGFALTPAQPLSVAIPGGHSIRCSETISGKLNIQGWNSTVTAYLLDEVLEDVDIILGCDWLQANGVSLNFSTRLAEISAGGKKIQLKPDAEVLPDMVDPKLLIMSCVDRLGLPPPSLITPKQASKLLKTGAKRFLAYVKPQFVPTTQPAESEQREGFVAFLGAMAAAETEPERLPAEIQAVLDKYPDVFKDLEGLPPDRGVGHTINLEPNSSPPFRRMYRMSQPEREEVKRQITDLLAKGYIEPSSSPYGAPVLFVEKKDGTLRMCIDYRMLNKITIRDRYPLPRIDDLFDKAAGCTVFSSIDLQAGYHQIRITPEDVPKTAFVTPLGQFQFKVLCFGLTNAPATFQRVMDNVFKHLIGKSVALYLDDCLCMSPNMESHVVHLEEVLETLRKNRLFAKRSKCSFAKPSLTFLGHVLGGDGLKADPSKIKTIVDWPLPRNLKDLQGFLGLANFLRRYIQGYSTLTAPLTSITQGSAHDFPWQDWPPDKVAAFESIKEALTSPPVLTLPDFTKPFEVRTDASLLGTGGVLMQDGRVIAYTSKKFTAPERNYHTTDQELLGLVRACQEWRCYLEGGEAKLITDHQPLTHLATKQDLSRRQARWSEFLSRFNFKILYEPGVGNVADPISRNPLLAVARWAVKGLLSMVTRRQAKQQAQVSPQEMPVVEPPPPVMPTEQEVMPRQEPQPQAPLPPAHPLNIKDRILEAYAADPRMSDTDFADHLDLSEDGLFLTGNGTVFVPDSKSLKEAILHEMHDAQYAGHVGITKTLERVSRLFWWEGMRRDVHQYVTHCDLCQRNKSRNDSQGFLQPLPVPGWRWESVSFDLIVKLPRTAAGHDSICVFVDRLSKMVHLVPCSESMQAEDFAQLFLQNVYRLHGMPRHIVSDRGTHWKNAFWAALCRIVGMAHGKSTAYHPQTDGQTERTNRTLEDMLRHYCTTPHTNWDSVLPFAEFAINNSWQESIQNTPFYVNYGQHPVTPGIFDFPRGPHPSAETFVKTWQTSVAQAKKCLRAAQQRQAEYYNSKRVAVTFQVGDSVLLSTVNLKKRMKHGAKGSNKLLPKFVGPLKVVKLVGKAAVQLELPSAWRRVHNVFHVSLVRHYRPDAKLVHFPPPVDLENNSYEVERILAHKDKGRRGKKYLVRWVGWGPQHDTWEPRSHLSNCLRLLKAYHKYAGLPLDAELQEAAD